MKPKRTISCWSGVFVSLVVAVLHSPAVAQSRDSVEAIFTDPPPDTAFPPELKPLQIPSGGVRINGVLYAAQGEGPHKTVVLVHGLPGHERNFDLAHFIRRAGMNAVVFHPRGAWGSEGAYSYSNAIADVSAVLKFFRDPKTAKSYRVDHERLVLVGHSFGGFSALLSAAKDPDVTIVASIAGSNLGAQARALGTRKAFQEAAQRRQLGLGPLRGTSGVQLTQEIVDNGERWDVVRQAPVLATKRVLLVAGLRDTTIPASELYEPLVDVLRNANAQELTAVTLNSDHSFSDQRIALARVVVKWLLSISL